MATQTAEDAKFEALDAALLELRHKTQERLRLERMHEGARVEERSALDKVVQQITLIRTGRQGTT